MPDVTISIRAENLASGETKKLQIDIANLTQAFNETETAAKGFGQRLSAIEPHLQGIASGANAFAANIVGLGKGFVDAALKVEGFKTALANMEGSAAAAEQRFAELQKVAQLPGLSLEGAVQGAVHLKNIGLEADLVDRTLKEFGNSLALVGSTDLSGALQGLTRLVSKGKVVTQDLQQITDRAPQVTKALQSIFNTTQADEIQKQLDASGKSVKEFVNILVTELEKGARASEGPTTSAIGSLNSALFDLKASLGETLLPAVTAVAKALTSLVNGVNSLSGGTKTAIVALGAVTAGASALVGGLATLGVAIAGIKAGLAALGITATAAGAAIKAALGPIGIVVAVVGGAIAAYEAFAASKRKAAKAAEELRKEQERELQAIVAAANQISPGSAVLDVQIQVAKVDLETARKELRDLEADLKETNNRFDAKRIQNDINAQTHTVTDLLSAYTALSKNRAKSETELNVLAKDYLQTKKDQLQADLDAGRVNKENIEKVVGQITSIEKALRNIKSVKVEVEVETPAPEVRNFQLAIVNLGYELDTLNDKLKNTANAADLKAAFDEAIAASKELTQTRLAEIDAEIDAAQKVIDNAKATKAAKASAVKDITSLNVRRRQAEIAGEKEVTAITREETEKRKEIARGLFENFVRELEQNKPDLRLDVANLEKQLGDVQDRLRNATSTDELQTAFAEAITASEELTQKRLKGIDAEIANTQAIIDNENATKADREKAQQEIADLQLKRLDVVNAAEQRATAIAREEAQKQVEIVREKFDNFVKQLEQNKPDFRLDLVNLEKQLGDVQTQLRNATSTAALQAAFAAAVAASEELTQKRLAQIDAEIAVAQTIIGNADATKEAREKAEADIAALNVRRRQAQIAGEKEVTAITREEAQKQIEIAREISDNFVEQLEQNKPDLRLDLAKLETQFGDIEDKLKAAATPEDLQAAFTKAIALSKQLTQTRLKDIDAEIKIAQQVIASTKTTTEAKAKATKDIANLKLKQYELETAGEQKLTEITAQESDKRAQLRQEELSAVNQQLVGTLAAVPTDLLGAAYDSLVTIPLQTRDALRELSDETQTRIQELKESESLSAREKANQIAEIEREAARRRIEIEQDANRAKIESFKGVVSNFIAGIGRMIAEQVKLRAATAVTNALLGAPGQSGGGGGIGGILGSALPFLAAVNPALAIGGGLALGATALFASSFDDPVNDALARRAGIQASQQRASRAAIALGRRSAVDLRDNFEQGFVTETARQTGAPGESGNPVIMNEIKLVIGSQELKALYEETQRQITTGIIAR